MIAEERGKATETDNENVSMNELRHSITKLKEWFVFCRRSDTPMNRERESWN